MPLASSRLAIAAALLLLSSGPARAADAWPTLPPAPLGPGHSSALADALEKLGAPLPPAERAALEAAVTTREVQQILDPHALFAVQIGPDWRVRTITGPARRLLTENGWRPFLVKVINDGAAPIELKVESPEAAPIYRMYGFPGSENRAGTILPEDVPGRWASFDLYKEAPFAPKLSGALLEYRILQVLCADRELGATLSDHDRRPGPRSKGAFQRLATVSFSAGPGTEELAPQPVTLGFSCQPSTEVVFRVLDDDGAPTTASFTVLDTQGRFYPPKSKRLAPDFFFHPQAYRRDGERMWLPPGTYSVEYTRGPEYRVARSRMVVPPPEEGPVTATFKLERWIDPAKLGWVSGDSHMHASGCVHYDQPTPGVFPADMWRHLLGEDLKIGEVLLWKPSYYFQRQFFRGGQVHPLSTDRNVLRYDVEVSGYSHHEAGHNVYLGLKEEKYPGTEILEDWPRTTLPVVRWAKKQGAAVGVAHAGWGLAVPDRSVPSFEMPKFDGIGANEFVVLLTHQVPGPRGQPVPAVDFISGVDTPHVWELSVWYHALNAGFRPRFVGESDFPCILDDRVGLGRSYVKLDTPQKVAFDPWVRGLERGRSYASDGRSHLLDFKVEGVAVGEGGSELKFPAPRPVRVTVKVAALLPETPDPELQQRPYDKPPYWDLERARLGNSREVPLELVVNGRVVTTRQIVADGQLREVRFDALHLERSSWVAARILPSSHTNPIWVTVAGKPVRADRRSAEWLLRAVDVCWAQKSPRFWPEELKDAEAAYEHARAVYRRILAEMPAAPAPQPEPAATAKEIR